MAESLQTATPGPTTAEPACPHGRRSGDAGERVRGEAAAPGQAVTGGPASWLALPRTAADTGAQRKLMRDIVLRALI